MPSTSPPLRPPTTSWPSTRPLTRLEAEDPAKAQLVKLRYFAGLTEEEAAQVLGISRATRQTPLALRQGLALLRVELTEGRRRKNRQSDGPADDFRAASLAYAL